MAAGICSSLVAPEMNTKSFNKKGLVGMVTNGFMTHRQPYSGVHRIWKTQAQIQYKTLVTLALSRFCRNALNFLYLLPIFPHDRALYE